ncbi:hypothetical protein CQ010_07245 [Arthrobacter sp. MYb211]|nr:hypothetical protein CQ015_07940 [Arthrobacter sp. MYb221]PRC08235.1 hypothetical protein CQ010_07245 [Arthrobacter sp. MYb211]
MLLIDLRRRSCGPRAVLGRSIVSRVLFMLKPHWGEIFCRTQPYGCESHLRGGVFELILLNMGQNAPNGQAPGSTRNLTALPGNTMSMGRFLRQLPGEVRVVHDSGDLPLRWVEPSDMDDPTDYLLDNELILTSGFPLVGVEEDQQKVDEFIHRLSEAKVSALGFGLEPYFTEIPKTVIRACKRFNLTLWEIPASLPFAAVGIAFSKLLEADGAALLRNNAEANRALIRCVSDRNPEQQLVATLSQRAQCTVRLFGSTLRLRYSACAPDGPTLSSEVTELLYEQATQSDGSQQFALLQDSTGTHLGFPIRAVAPGRRQAALLGVLQASFAQTPTAVEHNLVATALGLLEVVARQKVSGSFAPTQLASSLLLGSRSALDEQQLRLLIQSTGGAQRQIRVAAIAQQSPDPESNFAHHITTLRSLLETRLVSSSGEQLLALTQAAPNPHLFKRLEDAGYLAAFSHPAAVDERAGSSLGDLAIQAKALLPRILEERRSLDAAQLPRTFASLLPQEASMQLAEQRLAGVLALPAARRDLYLAVLRAWLGANGSWDLTASTVSLHRNSVRRHIGTIGELLHVDLTEATIRMELLLALSFIKTS